MGEWLKVEGLKVEGLKVEGLMIETFESPVLSHNSCISVKKLTDWERPKTTYKNKRKHSLGAATSKSKASTKNQENDFCYSNFRHFNLKI